jgi:N-acyl-D-aspartate/D-glutamate deacylase
MLAASEEANKRGLTIVPQVAARGLGLLMALDSYHVFQPRRSYMEIAHLPRAERAKAMRDPARRSAILSESNVGPDEAPSRRILGSAQFYGRILRRFYKMTPPIDYEPSEDKRLDNLAEATGQSMEAVLYDTLAEGDGNNMFVDFVMNYTNGNLDSVHDMLENPTTLSGLGDGGAHLLSICDAAMTTYHLSFWSRDRKRGPILQLENMVAKLTSKPADVFGFDDRGVIAVGKRADLNVIDFENINNAMPEITFDLPLGSGRLLQSSNGYRATLVNGVVTRRNDQDTGARPGRLVRAGVH